MILGLTSSKRPILETSRSNHELLRRAGAGPGLHAQLVSPAVHAVRAHAKQCRGHPVYGSRVAGEREVRLGPTSQSFLGGDATIFFSNINMIDMVLASGHHTRILCGGIRFLHGGTPSIAHCIVVVVV